MLIIIRKDSLHAGVHHLHPGGHGLHHHHHRAGQVGESMYEDYKDCTTQYRREYAESWRKMQELWDQIQAQLKLAQTLKKLGDHAGERNSFKPSENLYLFSDKNGLPLDLDIGGDLADLKKNLAKYKKGKHGKELDDIDIEELDFVSITT